MSLKTRLDGRTEGNSSFKIVDHDGVELAEIVGLDNSINLRITTAEGLMIQKPNGWKSCNCSTCKEGK